MSAKWSLPDGAKRLGKLLQNDENFLDEKCCRNGRTKLENYGNEFSGGEITFNCVTLCTTLNWIRKHSVIKIAFGKNNGGDSFAIKMLSYDNKQYFYNPSHLHKFSFEKKCFPWTEIFFGKSLFASKQKFSSQHDQVKLLTRKLFIGKKNGSPCA